MKPEHIFPSLLIALDLAAGLVYAWGGDYKQFGYWASAASITYFATFRA